MLDSDFKKIWTKELKELPSNLRKQKVAIQVTDYLVDDDDNIYLSTHATSEAIFKEFSKIEICKITSDGKASLIDLGEATKYQVIQSWLNKDNDGKIKCILAYTKDSQKALFNGIVHGEIKNNKIINTFSTEISPTINTSKNAIGNYYLSPAGFSCQLKKLPVNEDNSNVYIFEFSYIRLEVGYKSTKDNIIFKVNADNSIAWSKVLPKNQQATTTSSEVGYKYIKNEDYHYLIFLDSKDSKSTYSHDTPAELFTGKGVLSYYKIEDEFGNVSKHKILETATFNDGVSDLYMNSIISLGAGKLVIEASKSKKENLLISVNLD